MGQLDELYAGDFEGFVARRNDAAKRLREEGDSDAADRVRALRKPSRVAWAINQAAARAPRLAKELLAAADALRDAQESLVSGKTKGADLRKASDREHAAVAGMLEAARAIARDAGTDLSAAAAEKARQTLHSVARDEAVRREFEQRRLTTERESSGLDGFTGAGAAPAPAPAPKNADDKRAAAQRRELQAAERDARRSEEQLQQAERDLTAARSDAEQAQRELQRASQARDRATRDAEAARAKLNELAG